MKQYLILADFNGSQTGNDFQKFAAGTTVKLSDDLARLAVGEGWAKLALPEPLTGGPHPKLEAEPDAPNVLVESSLAEDRETKVVEPEETKPDAKAKKKK